MDAKKRIPVLLIVTGFFFCILGVVFKLTIGWFSVPLVLGIGIILLIAGFIKKGKRGK